MLYWVTGIVALVAAVYFAFIVRTALRAGEIARFYWGSSFAIQLMMDMLAESSPELRGLEYISRREHPRRFWFAISLRVLLVAIGLAGAVISFAMRGASN